MKYFNDETRAARALQCWQILIGCAHRRETITYKMLAKILGFDRPGGGTSGAGVIGSLVGPIMFWCARNAHNGVPPLTCILVNERTGVPGDGFTDTRGKSIEPTGCLQLRLVPGLAANRRRI